MRAHLVWGFFGVVSVVALVNCVGDEPAPLADSGDAASTSDSSTGTDGASGGDADLPDVISTLDGGLDVDSAASLKQAFVTDEVFNGHMDRLAVGVGGINAADAQCTAVAQDRFPGRTFKAYLATTTEGAVTHVGMGPWYVGTAFLASVSDLKSDGAVKTKLNVTQTGKILTTSASAWTGASANGDLQGANQNCLDWTTSASSELGRVGTVGADDGFWVSAGGLSCDVNRRLYCFEQ